MNIGFIGLGIMGRGMARNLARKHQVTAWNRTTRPALKKQLPGVRFADSIEEAVRDREVVLVSVTGPEAQAEIFHGTGGILAHVSRGTLLFDLTTTSPDSTKRLAEAAARAGIEYIDSPVFGSKEEAWNGKLDVVWGGPARLKRKAQPLFHCLAKSAHRLGESGSGTAMKLIGNNIVAAEFMALAEGLSLARKSGLDLKALVEVLSVVDYGSGLLVSNARNAIKNDFTPFFYLKHMLKDTRLVAELGRLLEVPVPNAALAAQSFQAAVNDGLGEENVSALIKYQARRSGLKG